MLFRWKGYLDASSVRAGGVCVIGTTVTTVLSSSLVRVGLSDAMAEAARNAIEASAIGGVLGQSPYAVFGGGVQPIRDAEDLGALETAIAGNADFLVTHNIKDFMPGPRADIDAKVVRIDPQGSGDVLLVRHGKSRFGLVIASVFAAKARLLDGVLPPAGVFERFLPAVTHPAAPPSRRLGR